MPNFTPRKKAPKNTTGPLGLRFLILTKQGITNTTALPIDKMLYIHLLCPHSEHQKSRSDLNSLNTFTKETGSNKVETSKSWIQCDSPCPCGGRAQQNKQTTFLSSRIFESVFKFENTLKVFNKH